MAWIVAIIGAIAGKALTHSDIGLVLGAIIGGFLADYIRNKALEEKEQD
jgi:uncharacterized protein YqgC (DUF456 family)